MYMTYIYIINYITYMLYQVGHNVQSYWDHQQFVVSERGWHDQDDDIDDTIVGNEKGRMSKSSAEDQNNIRYKLYSIQSPTIKI